MKTRYSFGDNEIPHLVTFAVINWIDVISREDYRVTIIAPIRFKVPKGQ